MVRHWAPEPLSVSLCGVLATSLDVVPEGPRLKLFEISHYANEFKVPEHAALK
jgi:hypothetical protein